MPTTYLIFWRYKITYLLHQKRRLVSCLAGASLPGGRQLASDVSRCRVVVVVGTPVLVNVTAMSQAGVRCAVNADVSRSHS